jgi:O-glycosyl hydrolase
VSVIIFRSFNIKNIFMSKSIYLHRNVRLYGLLLLGCGLCSSAAIAGEAATAVNRTAQLRVDNSITHQYIRGFGGFAFSSTWGDNLSDEEIQTMYGKGTRQLGYNIMRARIAPEEYTSWGHDSWGTTASVIKKCRALGSLVFASAWTPPAAYKSNNNTVHGTLLPEHYADYANFLNRFIDRIVACGTDVDYISLQNEPDYEPDEYESCTWSAKNFIDFYTTYGTQLKRPLIGPESLAFRVALSDSILQNDAACAQLAIVGGHLYGGGNFDYPLAREKGKEKWMTEYLINHGDDDKTTAYTWDDALFFARVVNTSMLANYSAWCHYALKSSYGMMGDGTCGTTDGEPTKRGYALAHFAKYITGTTRIEHTLNDPEFGLTTSAYQTASGDSIVLMLINSAVQTYDVTIDLPFKTKGGRRILTRQSSNIISSNVTLDESSTLVISVPAKSIETLILVKSGERDTPQEALRQPIFSDGLYEAYHGESVVPEGWKITHKGTVFNGKGQSTSVWDGSKARLYFYSPESPLKAGILLAASSSSKNGSANYGALDNDHRLTLEPGDYRLTWHGIGWDHEQKIYCYVRQVETTQNLAYHSDVTVSATVEGLWGSEHDTFEATVDTLDFTVTQRGNYELNWKVTYYANNATDNLCRALIGGITLESLSNESPSSIGSLHTEQQATRIEYYDLSGRRVIQPGQSGLYLRRSTDTNGRRTIEKFYVVQ